MRFATVRFAVFFPAIFLLSLSALGMASSVFFFRTSMAMDPQRQCMCRARLFLNGSNAREDISWGRDHKK